MPVLSGDMADPRYGRKRKGKQNRALAGALGDRKDAPLSLAEVLDFEREALAAYVGTKELVDEPKAAGVAVVAEDTGRVLMLQRVLDDDDPNGGKWEFPGGRIDEGESPYEAACREFAEEVGVPCSKAELVDTWTSPNGVYVGHLMRVASEKDLNVNLDHEDRRVRNPDDPDGDGIEVVAWFDPADLQAMPQLRDEVRWATPWDLLFPPRLAEKGVRRVRTPEGARAYDLPIGAIIRRDAAGNVIRGAVTAGAGGDRSALPPRPRRETVREREARQGLEADARIREREQRAEALRERPLPPAGKATTGPVLTPDTADAFSAQSVLKQDLYHVTTAETAAAIRSGGFEVRRGKTKPQFGTAVYLNDTQTDVYMPYGGGERLTARVDLRNPLRITTGEDAVILETLQAAGLKLGPKNAELLRQTRAQVDKDAKGTSATYRRQMLAIRTNSRLDRDELARDIQRQGYDGLIVDGTKSGRQVVVYDAAKVAVVVDAPAAPTPAAAPAAGKPDYAGLDPAVAKKIRKRKAAVKFYAQRRDGLSPAEAQAKADEYERDALAEARGATAAQAASDAPTGAGQDAGKPAKAPPLNQTGVTRLLKRAGLTQYKKPGLLQTIKGPQPTGGQAGFKWGLEYQGKQDFTYNLIGNVSRSVLPDLEKALAALTEAGYVARLRTDVGSPRVEVDYEATRAKYATPDAVAPGTGGTTNARTPTQLRQEYAGVNETIRDMYAEEGVAQFAPRIDDYLDRVAQDLTRAETEGDEFVTVKIPSYSEVSMSIDLARELVRNGGLNLKRASFGPRRVRTVAGARMFDRPIGAPIRAAELVDPSPRGLVTIVPYRGGAPETLRDLWARRHDDEGALRRLAREIVMLARAHGRGGSL